MKLLSIKTKGLQKAIDEYFTVKSRGNGFFTDQVEKDRILDNICSWAKREHKGCAIVPGAIVLNTKTKHVWITSPSKDEKWVISENIY